MNAKSFIDSVPSRRTFLQTGLLLAGAPLGFPAILSSRAPSEKLHLAIIGCGGRGAGNMKEVAGENIVALCDVNAQYLERAGQLYPQARRYRDFRELYAKVEDIDAVVVSTTEHTHAFAVLPALRKKKHVFCEKPLTRDVHEAYTVMEAAKKAGVATQMGTQIHAGTNYRRVVELIQGNAIGPVKEVHVWVSRAWGLQSKEDAEKNKDIVFVTDRPKETMPVPAHIDWNLWIGPAPWRPYNDVYLPGPKWYRWWDFANGTMSDLGSHWNDLPFWALKLEHPLFIESSGPAVHAEIAPASMSTTYEFGARGPLPPVKMTWYQGSYKPALWTEKKIPQWANGVLFVGEAGMLLSDYRQHVLLPEEKYKDFIRPQPTILDSIGHHLEWIHACKTGAPTTCHFAYSGLLTISNHLGGVAYRAGRRIAWDPRKRKITNVAEANRLLSRKYRSGWKLK